MVDTEGVRADVTDRRSRWLTLGSGAALAASAGLLAVRVAPTFDSTAIEPRPITWANPAVVAVLALVGAALAATPGVRRQRTIWVAVGGWLVVFFGTGTDLAFAVVIGVVLVFGALAKAVVMPNAYPPRSPWLALFGSGVAVTALVIVVFVLNHAIVSGWEEGRPYRRPFRPRLGERRWSHRRSAGASPADLWHRSAASEAASVPTFDTLAGRLDALGAPDDLIDRCQQAAADEDRHARICHRLARHHGSLIDPPPVPVSPNSRPRSRSSRGSPRFGRRVELARLAVDSLADGLGGEGFAAARLESGATTTDPEAARLQRSLARDERAHTDLAADVVAWCLRTDPEVVAPSLRIAGRRLPHEIEAPAANRRFDGRQLAAVGMVPTGVAANLWSRHRHATLARLDELLEEHYRSDSSSSFSDLSSSEPSSSDASS